jgi:hypothetical protein
MDSKIVDEKRRRTTVVALRKNKLAVNPHLSHLLLTSLCRGTRFQQSSKECVPLWKWGGKNDPASRRVKQEVKSHIIN